MGLLDWFFGTTSSSQPPRTPVPATVIDARGDGHLAVVGESFYNRGFQHVTGGAPGDYKLELLLVRDPNNSHDANCINVLTRDGIQLGNLSRGNAERFAEGLDRNGGAALVDARVRRSPEHENWNVVLRVDWKALEGL